MATYQLYWMCLSVCVHICVFLCVTQLDALEWRCVYFPSGHNKQATKYDIILHVAPI